MVTLVLLVLLVPPFLIIGGILALFWKKRRRSVFRWATISYFITAIVLLFAVGPYFMAWWLVTNTGTRPQDKQLKDTPADYGVDYEDVIFQTRDSLNLSGWFIPPTTKHAVLICTHGLFRNRVELLARTMAANEAGYGALLYDSRSHGSSEKGLVSLGYFERNDVLGAMEYVRRRYQDSRPYPQIVLMGVSMGAVATLQAAAESRDYSALILDSPFSSLNETVVDHSWLFFKLPRYTLPSLFLFWFRNFTGFDSSRVNAREALARSQPVPILFVSSEGDRRISAEVVRSLYQSTTVPRRRIKIFGKDVGHGAAARLHPEAYAALLVDFLDSSLEPIEKGDDGLLTETSEKED